MSSSSHSKQLLTKIRLAEPHLLEVSDQFWRHPRLKEMFPEFLFMMHSVIRSSVSLINTAAKSAEGRAETDPVCRKLADYYRSHALEEMHHDDWLLADMTWVGMESEGQLAVAEFQKMIAFRWMNYPLAALARLGLGRAYAMQSDTAKAKAAYQDFLILWEDADPDVPILKQARAEYARLQ